MRSKVLIIGALVGLVLSACVPPEPGPDPSSSPSPSASVKPSPTVSASPITSAEPSIPPPLSPSPTAPPSPTPNPQIWPAANNTGYPHGLPGDTRPPVTLTDYTGPTTITTANTVIDSKRIRGQLNIRAAGVVIKNSLFLLSNTGAINVNNVYHLTVMDTELDGQGLDNSSGGISLIGDGSYTLIRVNAHRSGDIARINWGGVAIIDSWLHDTQCIQSSCHNDVLQSTDGNCNMTGPSKDAISGPVPGTSDNNPGDYCIKIVHNRLENPQEQTSCILLKADQDNIHDVLVKDNLFNGGGYTVYWYDSNDMTTFHATKGKFINNRFMRAPAGYFPNGGRYGPAAFRAVELPEWTGNVWDDNGQVIPR